MMSFHLFLQSLNLDSLIVAYGAATKPLREQKNFRIFLNRRESADVKIKILEHSNLFGQVVV